MRLLLSAQLREEIHLIRSGVAVVEVGIDALVHPRRARSGELAKHAGERRARAEAARVARAHRRRICGGGRQPLIVLPVRRREVGQRYVAQQRRRLRADSVRGNLVVSKRLSGLRIVDGRLPGEISAAQRLIRHRPIVVEGRRGVIADQRQEDKVLRVVLNHMRDIR